MIIRRHITRAKNIRKQFVVLARSSTKLTCLTEMDVSNKTCLENIFLESVHSVHPQKLIRNYLRTEGTNLIIGRSSSWTMCQNVAVVGFGKAVLGLAAETERILDSHLKCGVICLPKSTMETFQDKEEFRLKPNSVINVYEGAEGNLPDWEALNGANAVVELINSLCANDILLVLISGGGSALLPRPRQGISLEDKMKTTKLLSRAGATINELNTVRKKLSEVKGGGLAEMSYPLKTFALILSDIVNDPLDFIASGPTVPNSDNPKAAYDILKKYDLLSSVSPNVVTVAQTDHRNPYVPICNNKYVHVENFLIGNNEIALNQARISAEKANFGTLILTKAIDSPVHTICDFYIKLAFEICKLLYLNEVDKFVTNMSDILRNTKYNLPTSLVTDILDLVKLMNVCSGICLIAGGETTVKVTGDGYGGRNQELALMFSQKMYKLKKTQPGVFRKYDVTLLSAGTDGIDGNSDAAGAVGCIELIERAMSNGVDPGSFLCNNDSNTFFRLANKGSHLITTGHTGTNVMDIHLIVIQAVPPESKC